eukprot:371604-Pelagomonas_calceolata.AAC.3
MDAGSFLKCKPSGVMDRIASKVGTGEGCVRRGVITLNSLALGNGICAIITHYSSVRFNLVEIIGVGELRTSLNDDCHFKDVALDIGHCFLDIAFWTLLFGHCFGHCFLDIAFWFGGVEKGDWWQRESGPGEWQLQLQLIQPMQWFWWFPIRLVGHCWGYHCQDEFPDQIRAKCGKRQESSWLWMMFLGICCRSEGSFSILETSLDVWLPGIENWIIANGCFPPACFRDVLC